MDKRKKREHDFSVTAFRVVQEATGQIEPKPAKTFDAKALGHLGGLKGGHARAARLTLERRVEIAKKAALAGCGVNQLPLKINFSQRPSINPESLTAFCISAFVIILMLQRKFDNANSLSSKGNKSTQLICELWSRNL